MLKTAAGGPCPPPKRHADRTIAIAQRVRRGAACCAPACPGVNAFAACTCDFSFAVLCELCAPTSAPSALNLLTAATRRRIHFPAANPRTVRKSATNPINKHSPLKSTETRCNRSNSTRKGFPGGVAITDPISRRKPIIRRITTCCDTTVSNHHNHHASRGQNQPPPQRPTKSPP